jgi:hypothetical protein
MKVWFAQVYFQAGVCFPFSGDIQPRLSEEITALVEPSPKFLEKYGKDFELMFRISAKRLIKRNQIKGPMVFRKTKDVEYFIYLPFEEIARHADAPRRALKSLFEGVYKVLDSLEIDKTKLVERQESLIVDICSDPTMLEEPSWDEARNNTRVRRVFEAFFNKKRA